MVDIKLQKSTINLMKVNPLSIQHDHANTVMDLDVEEPELTTMTESVQNEPTQENQQELFYSAHQSGKRLLLPPSIQFED